MLLQNYSRADGSFETVCFALPLSIERNERMVPPLFSQLYGILLKKRWTFAGVLSVWTSCPFASRKGSLVRIGIFIKNEDFVRVSTKAETALASIIRKCQTYLPANESGKSNDPYKF
jgi:hypothetical protein